MSKCKLSPAMQKALKTLSTESDGWVDIRYRIREPTMWALKDRGLVEHLLDSGIDLWKLTEKGREEAGE